MRIVQKPRKYFNFFELLIALEGSGKETLCSIIINAYETGKLTLRNA
jgi:hypothetical protein